MDCVNVGLWGLWGCCNARRWDCGTARLCSCGIVLWGRRAVRRGGRGRHLNRWRALIISHTSHLHKNIPWIVMQIPPQIPCGCLATEERSQPHNPENPNPQRVPLPHTPPTPSESEL